MATADELAAVPLFASLTESERSELARSFESRAVSEDVELAGQGASGYSFFILAEGSAVVTVGDSTIAQLGRGDFFGEGAILGSGRRTATVTTTSPSRVLVMFGTEFRRLALAHPEIAAAIEDIMEERSGAAGD